MDNKPKKTMFYSEKAAGTDRYDMVNGVYRDIPKTKLPIANTDCKRSRNNSFDKKMNEVSQRKMSTKQSVKIKLSAINAFN